LKTKKTTTLKKDNNFNYFKKKIANLTKKLNQANTNYYYYKPLISDEVYDALLLELKTLEEKYPQFKLENSPNNKVGAFLKTKTKFKHKIIMKSLNNCFEYDELNNFFNRIKKKFQHKNLNYYCEYKIDGLSISLEYKNQVLIKALTRGNGIEGEDITNNAKQIINVPSKIKTKNHIVIRGEVFLTKEDFSILNKNQILNNKKIFLNARNAASGTLRHKDFLVVKKRNLKAFFYYFDDLTTNLKLNQDQQILNLKKLNFETNFKYNKLLKENEVKNYIEVLKTKKDQLNYFVDGVVIKLNDINFATQLGNTLKYPRHAIAYKFKTIISKTQIKKIIVNLSRFGKITYKAQLEPILLDGSIIKFATLHNLNFIYENDLRINDFVLITKAGSVIPKIIKSIPKLRLNNSAKYIPPLYCLFCGKKLLIDLEKNERFCTNKNCIEIKLQNLFFFVSKNCFNIVGFSKKNIIKFFKLKLIKDEISIFELIEKKEELFKIKSFQLKSINNLINAIKQSKTITFAKFIHSLSIKYIGLSHCNEISKNFLNINQLLNANIMELKKINSIGEVAALNIFNFFNNLTNQEKIKKLLNLKLNIINDQYNFKNNKALNYQFVISGTLKHKRFFYEKIITKNNCKLQNQISKNTNYLLLGENYGNKYQKAKQLNIKIINEKEFYQIFKNET